MLKESIDETIGDHFAEKSTQIDYTVIGAEEARLLLADAINKDRNRSASVSPTTDDMTRLSEPTETESLSRDSGSPVWDPINEGSDQCNGSDQEVNDQTEEEEEPEEEKSEEEEHEEEESEESEEPEVVEESEEVNECQEEKEEKPEEIEEPIEEERTVEEEQNEEDSEEESDSEDDELNEWNGIYKRLAALMGTRMEATAQFDAHYMLSQLNLLFRSVKNRNDSHLK